MDFLLFNLLILKCLTDKTGHVWRRSELDLYLIENMPLMKTTGPRVSILILIVFLLSFRSDQKRALSGWGKLGKSDAKFRIHEPFELES